MARTTPRQNTRHAQVEQTWEMSMMGLMTDNRDSLDEVSGLHNIGVNAIDTCNLHTVPVLGFWTTLVQHNYRENATRKV